MVWCLLEVFQRNTPMRPWQEWGAAVLTRIVRVNICTNIHPLGWCRCLINTHQWCICPSNLKAQDSSSQASNTISSTSCLLHMEWRQWDRFNSPICHKALKSGIWMIKFSLRTRSSRRLVECQPRRKAPMTVFLTWSVKCLATTHSYLSSRAWTHNRSSSLCSPINLNLASFKLPKVWCKSHWWCHLQATTPTSRWWLHNTWPRCLQRWATNERGRSRRVPAESNHQSSEEETSRSHPWERQRLHPRRLQKRRLYQKGR